MEMDRHFLPSTKISQCCLMLSLFAFSLQLLLLSQTAFAVNNNGSSSMCFHYEKLALLQLKHGFSIVRGDYNNASSRLDSWNPDVDCCSWEGITCDEAMGYVIGLDLGSNWPLDSSSSVIEGRIDSSLFHLGSLQKFNISGNNFYPYPISSGFGLLTNLTYLDLSRSNFSGQIPLEISKLTKLISLDLSDQSVHGPLLELRNPSLTRFIQNLSNLRQLSLDQVNISEDCGKWAQALSIALPNLRKLSLRECGLRGPIDPTLLRHPFLSQISLDENNLSNVVLDFMVNSSALTSLSLRGCGLYGKFSSNIFLLPHLQMLDISCNPCLTIHLPEFPQNSALRYLYMSKTRIHEKLPNSIGNLKFLKVLSLPNCELFGSLPSSITNLPQLEILDLSSNNFSGMISFSNENELQHLTHLYLDKNTFEGSIPLSLFSHPSLQVLSLSYNQLNGCLHDVSPSVLEVIHLDYNKLSGAIPRSIFELTKLTHLSLDSNHFIGTIGLHMFRNIKALSYLCLSNNNLSFINNNDSSHLISSSQIHFLHLSSCNISKFPGILQNLNHLQYLVLSNNKIHGEIPSWIWKVGNGALLHLNLSNNFLESFEHPLSQFSSLSHLQVVDFHSNRLQGSLPVFPPQVYFQDYSNNSFTSIIPTNVNFTFIKFLFLSNNHVSGEIPLSICDAHILEILDLSNNRFGGKLPTCLSEIGKSLKILNLHGNAFHGNVPEMFKKDCTLGTLNLNSNQLEGPIPQSFANCKTLEVLDLGNNHLNDTFPFWLENLSNLRILILRSNTFHGPIVDSHTTSPMYPLLQIFDISSNFFAGVVPPTFFFNWKLMTGEDGSSLCSKNQIVGREINGFYYQDSVTITMRGIDLEVTKILIALTSIDLSNNRFHGDIPKSICTLKLLHVLNLSYNGFTGPIPSSLGNLAQLESLDLSRNKLSGNIPCQLTNLTFLAVLNLSQNLLTGSIPQNQQFLTFSNCSFQGNAGLCGPPLTKTCVDTTAPPPSTFYGFRLDEGGEIDWKFLWIGSGVGFGFGFGAVFWTLALWRKGSKKYMQLIDRVFVHMLFK